MKIITVFIPLLLATSLLAGCSNIGAINGVSVNRVAGDSGNTSFCATNPMICMLGAAGVVAGTAAIIHNSKSNSTAAPVGG